MLYNNIIGTPVRICVDFNVSNWETLSTHY